MEKNYYCKSKILQTFFKKISDIKEDTRDAILATMNKKSRYKNIPNNEGTEGIKETPYGLLYKPIATKVIFKFLFLLLILNKFISDNINYL